MDNKTMYKLSYGLFVLTAKHGSKDNGCIINTAIQAASEPNQISIAINKANFTHDMVKETGEFTVSVISQDASFDLFKRFGFQSGRDGDKFEGYDKMERGANGIYFIKDGTNAYISVKVEQMIDLGSHTMFIGVPTDMVVLSDVESVTYAYYQSNIKPKPQPVAATPEGQTVWRCRICGYEYVGEQIPDDFICPICKHPASDFEKIVVPKEEPKEEPKAVAEEREDMIIYKCEICGKIHEEITAGGGKAVCCGQPMTKMVPGATDGAVEKHVPAYEVDGNKVSVTIGSVEHPMVDVHYIEWIAIETTAGMQRKNLKPGDVPKAEFILAEGEELVAVYDYCNLHGFWKA